MTVAVETSLRELIHADLDLLVAIRHDLHEHPELGYEEVRTSQVIRRELEAIGIEHVGGLAGGTGVLGLIPGDEGPAISLRADIDALPIVECSGKPWASKHEGRMHACGHDGHTTILLGAARALQAIARERGSLPRPVKLIFQPAEEGGAGGRRMVEDGVLGSELLGPAVERIYGLHCWPALKIGVMSSRIGAMLAAADTFEVEIVGEGCHAAMPHVGADPVVAQAAFIQSLQSIVSRSMRPTDPAVVSVTQVHGGTTHNVIPERVQLVGTIRALSDHARRLARHKLVEIAETVARAHDCHAEVTIHDGYPVTINDAACVAAIQTTVQGAFGEAAWEAMEQPVMGAEDFAFYGQQVPAAFFVMGLLAPGSEGMPQLHHPAFDFSDDAIPYGVETFCRLALGV